MVWIRSLYFTSVLVLGDNSSARSKRHMDAQGLYDPQHEHDACGVGFVVDIKGRKSHAIVRQALTGSQEPAASWRVRLRGQHRRRRRHSDSDAGRVPPQGRARSPAAGRASTASVWCFCRRPPTIGQRSRTSSHASSPKRVSSSSAGVTCRPTTARSVRAPFASSRYFDRSS